MDATEKEARRLWLAAERGKIPALQKAASNAKAAWLQAAEEQRDVRDSYAAALKAAKSAMDAAMALLADARRADAELVAEHTPPELQKAEAATGYAYRVHAQNRKRAQDDSRTQQEIVRRLSERKGHVRVDKETRKREADKAVYLESVAAEMIEREDALLAEHLAAREALTAATRAAHAT